jgi:hypothetical protein
VLEYLTRKTRRLISAATAGRCSSLWTISDPTWRSARKLIRWLCLTPYADRHRPRLRLWGVVTDFVPHRFWVVGERPRYVVADESGADRLVWLGVKNASASTVLGIPINPGFVTERHKSVSRDGERVCL